MRGAPGLEQPVGADDRHLLHRRRPSYLASHLHGRPEPQLAQLALIHGYTMVFWWCAGIFAAGAIICGALLRPGPLTGPEDIPARKPSLEAAPARS